jgi:hypothetical protein
MHASSARFRFTLFALGLILSLPGSVKATSRSASDTTGSKVDPEKEIAELLESIKGRESQPASQVFKNLQVFKNMPAGRLPEVMGAYSRALGVACDHCHVMDHWEKEDKPEKQIAREMGQMVGEINGKLLRGIKNLKSENPRIGCATCHRGQVHPATRMVAGPPRSEREH